MKKTRRSLRPLRILLALLILVNMVVIFLLSSENGQKSSETSGKVTKKIAEVTVRDFEQKPELEKAEIVHEMEHPVRKLAHMTEFGILGALIFLLLLTWKGKTMLRYGVSLCLTAAYAGTDEWHQRFSSGRGPQITDVLIDLSGAFITCTAVFAIVLFVRHRRKQTTEGSTNLKITKYHIPCEKLSKSYRIAVAADLHGKPGGPILEKLRKETPDLILIPGDLTDRDGIGQPEDACYGFLRDCAAIAPTFYSLGNHELGCYHRGNPFRKPKQLPLPDGFAERVAKTGVTLLDNAFVSHGELTICGLTSGLDGKRNQPDRETLARFAAAPGVHLLLCHHPEYYVPYVRETGVELTVCGHAHGGHWRFFGRGVYAPGQGLFPRYTSGVTKDGRCVISRGLGDHTRIPRLFNSRELVMIEFGTKQP